MGDIRKAQIPDKATYIHGYRYIKTFVDAYFADSEIIYIDLSTLFNQKSKVPTTLLKGNINLKDYKDGEIFHDPFGFVFIGKGKKGNKKKFLFHTDDVEMYSNQHLSRILLHINNCQRKENEDRAKFRKIIMWYMEIWKVSL
ncbi:unnamed protein product [Lactuca virosa]|uniref:Uncharacterized protein n=1 Tax=Lactuca virosa TaxID=75947 RepID=A0AAU9PA29_9ASTR|nr:unnamed protein product [Lactuca virosa]